MGNKLPDTVTVGTLGEIFSQLKLLEYGVQAAPPLKDSGNDLIAIKGEVVKYIQVKTSINGVPQLRNLPEIYLLVFLAHLVLDEEGVLYDNSEITVFSKDNDGTRGALTQELVDELWV